MIQKAPTVLFAARSFDGLQDLRSRLEAEGIRVLAADSTRRALDLTREEAPDVVVVDKELEPVTTAALVASMQTFTPSPEIVLLAGEAPRDVEAVRRSLGLLHYAVKPVDGPGLFDVIRRSLADRKAIPPPAPRKPALILCVDDDALQLNALSRILTRHGYRVYACETAARALESLPRVRPDLAIVDIMLPGTDGLDLTERIRVWSGGRMPILLLSALYTDETYHVALSRGARRYLTKPCPQEEVLRAVDDLLEEAGRAEEAEAGSP